MIPCGRVLILLPSAIFGACDKMTNGIGEPVAIYGRGEGLESGEFCVPCLQAIML